MTNKTQNDFLRKRSMSINDLNNSVTKQNSQTSQELSPGKTGKTKAKLQIKSKLGKFL